MEGTPKLPETERYAESVRETDAMTKPLAVKWAYRYHHLEFDYFDSMDEAVSMAGYASDDGQEALDCVEVWDDQGYRKLSADEVFRLYSEMEKRREAAAPPPKPIVGELFVTSPDGKEVLWSTFTAEDRIEEVATRLREHMGDRVRVRLIDGADRANG